MSAYATNWDLLVKQVESLACDQPHWLPALANVCALLWDELDGINWLGFYLAGPVLDERLAADELVLGPFMGKVACVRIPWGRGVCGTAAATDKTQRVDDVHAFAGHIACDAASRSEVVVPLHVDGAVVGVLDVDSPLLARFGADDVVGFEACARAVEQAFLSA
ncbi:MAG: GAF domain-containing protein [Atopobiaceae bacterium]|nr:GAF domain-containing protein [Atopobiaceae bacterium]